MSVDDHSKTLLIQHEKELVSLVNEIRSITNRRLKESNSIIGDDLLLHTLNNYHNGTDIEKLLQEQKNEMRATLLVAIIAVPIICAVIQRIS